MMYFQCLLEQENSLQTAWIPERGAKEKAKVELKDGSGFWKVIKVFKPGLDERALKAKQENDRNSLPSLRK